ncbi:hypothetical protein BH09ACT7_BH09ACT7_09600 [soil metagenome]
MDQHPNLGPELRQFAATILAMLDPLIQAAPALTPPADTEPGKCQQVWCPVCAMAAVAAGESHPLATTIAEHGAALLTLARALLNPEQPEQPAGGDGPGPSSHPTGGYQPIPVTVVE